MFGIPGDSITAIVIGVLYMKGINPGPTVFLQNPQFIYAVFLIFILANRIDAAARMGSDEVEQANPARTA